MTRPWSAAVLLAFFLATPAAAQTGIALDEVLASWQGDEQAQFVELKMLGAGQNQLSAGAGLQFFDVDGDPDTVRVFRFQPPDPTNATVGAKVLIATARLAQVSGVTPDYVIEAGVMNPDGGRVCYIAGSYSDCLAYGAFRGDNGEFGRRTPLTPDNRSLQRVKTTRDNRTDWDTTIRPTPLNNAGQIATLATLCGNQELSQGEECDGNLLDKQTCKTLGFARGKLSCDECHFDTTGCTLCGNDVIDQREECDGTDFGDKTCASIGFVAGGTFACTNTCKLDPAGCGNRFLVPGGGPVTSDCLGEWRVTNGTGHPTTTGKVKATQKCKDGDPACDADTTPGTCTWSVGICLARDDERLARCPARPIERWEILRPKPDQDADLTGRFAAAVSTLGQSSTSGGTVTFTALDGTERCTDDDVAVTVPAGKALKLQARVTPAGGKPRDVDTLKLVCKR